MNGKTGIVTGGASGIGRAIAENLLDRGAEVVIADVDQTQGPAVAEELGSAASFAALDVRDHEAFEDVAAETAATHGSIDVLVNNAGITQDKAPIEDTPIEERDEVMAINYDGVWNGCRAVLPHMKEQGSGAIVNMGSIASFRGLPDDASYCGSKAGVLNLTKAVATEVGDHGIRVNAVCPGFVETDLVERAFEKYEDAEEARAEAQEGHLLGRLAEPEEIAECVCFLASERASFVTGHGLVADGGYTV